LRKKQSSNILIATKKVKFFETASKIFPVKNADLSLFSSFKDFKKRSKEKPFDFLIIHKSFTPGQVKGLINKIRNNSYSLPVLVLCARNSTLSEKKKIVDAGADYILTEPFPPELLLEYSRQAIENSQLKKSFKSITSQKNEFAKIVDESPVVFFKWSNKAGHPVVYVSDNVANYGYTKEEFLNNKIHYESIIHPDDIEKALKDIQYYKKKGIDSYEQEYRILTKNKTVKWVRDYTNVVKNSHGKPLYTQGFIVDIAENKVYKRAFQESEAKFKTLFNTAKDAIFLMKDDAFIDCNEHTLTMFGCSREQIVDNTPFKFSPEYQPDGQSSRQKGQQLIMEALGGKPQYFYWKHKKYDGALFDAEVTLNSVEFAGEIYIQAIVRDVTERKKSEEIIRLQTAYFKQLFDSSPLAICMLNNEDRIININKGFENLFQYTLEEIKGLLLNDLIVPEGFVKEASVLSNEALGNEIVHHDTVRKRKDGNLIDVSIVGYPINIDNKLIGVYGIYMDISERKKSLEILKEGKKKAEEMNRLKSVFLANMSHELRTPLIGIIGYSEILSSEIEDPEFKTMAETIRISSLRLKDTLNSILDLSRVESNKYELKFQELNVADIVQETVRLFESFAKKKNLYLKTLLLDQDCKLKLDYKVLLQILSNLVNNGLKYTHEGGVTVELEKMSENENQIIEIRVIDTGIGIPDDAKNIIFEEFRQASEGPSRFFEGTGLGLTLTKKFTELLGGQILLKSIVGEGTTFTVRFPSNVKIKS